MIGWVSGTLIGVGLAFAAVTLAASASRTSAATPQAERALPARLGDALGTGAGTPGG